MIESPLIRLDHIDVFVHGDYNQYKKPDFMQSCQDQELLRQKWLQRALELSLNPNAGLFDFSTFLKYDPHGVNGFSKTAIEYQERIDLWNIERERIRHFKMLLKDRFFLMAGDYLPTANELTTLLASAGYYVDREKTTLLAYGEYFGDCPNIWGEHLQTQLLTVPQDIPIGEPTILVSQDLSFDPAERYF